MKLLKALLLVILMVTFSHATYYFEDIRNNSTYWMPYDLNKVATLVINIKYEDLNKQQIDYLHTVFKGCMEGPNTPRLYYWFSDYNVEGIVSKSWPELREIMYPADLNEIMIGVKEKLKK